jgi:hypothetical protein
MHQEAFLAGFRLVFNQSLVRHIFQPLTCIKEELIQMQALIYTLI